MRSFIRNKFVLGIFAILPFFLYLFCLPFITGCNGTSEKNDSTKTNCVDPKKINYNISILLDLSDRIDTLKNPFQYERDIDDIKSILTQFKRHIDLKSNIDLRNVNDRLRVFFDPEPKNQDIKKTVADLCIDFEKYSALTLKEQMDGKRNLLSSYESKFNSSLISLYHQAINNSNFLGSDIWSFFDESAKQKCIIDKPCYRNILIVFTDGYMYWPETMKQTGNRFSYIERNYSHLTKFRDKNLWEEDFDKNDYGFYKIKDKLTNLEVMVIEINPAHKDDYRILSKYWSNWLQEMDIPADKISIIKSDQQVYNAEEIRKFFE